MKTKQKEQYLTPAIEVIKMETEGGVMSGSMIGGIGDGGNAFSGNTYGRRTGGTTRHSYSGASTSELEDLINDILTIEK